MNKNLSELMKWIAESGVLDRTEKVTITITKDSIEVKYNPPIVDVHGVNIP